MAIKREGAALRLGACNDLCVGRCAWWELNGAGRAVVIERLTQLSREVNTDAEIVEAISGVVL